MHRLSPKATVGGDKLEHGIFSNDTGICREAVVGIDIILKSGPKKTLGRKARRDSRKPVPFATVLLYDCAVCRFPPDKFCQKRIARNTRDHQITFKKCHLLPVWKSASLKAISEKPQSQQRTLTSAISYCPTNPYSLSKQLLKIPLYTLLSKKCWLMH